ncbi:formylglycine-generating enzyme family protein [Marinobacter sp. 1Y8]
MVDAAKENLIFVEGGSFIMGDIGDSDGHPYDPASDNNKPPIQVTLDSFSISRYETTWKQFLTYLNDSGKSSEYTVESGYSGANVLPMSSNDDPLSPNFHSKPARSPNFQEAQGYCDWLAEKSGLPFALPTEAQWEYAARSRGKNTPYATRSGTIEIDPYLRRPAQYVDPSTPPSGNTLIHSSSKVERRPVGTYAPNSIGLYDMTGNVSEWTQDWYQPDFYQISSKENPSGPDSPLNPDAPKKVVRDWAGLGGHAGGEGTVFARNGVDLQTRVNGFRCVVNSMESVN